MSEDPKDFVFVATPGSPCRSWIINGYTWNQMTDNQRAQVRQAWRRYVSRCYDRRDEAIRRRQLAILYGQNFED